MYLFKKAMNLISATLQRFLFVLFCFFKSLSVPFLFLGILCLTLTCGLKFFSTLHLVLVLLYNRTACFRKRQSFSGQVMCAYGEIYRFVVLLRRINPW